MDLDFTEHEGIRRRERDGYICASDICRVGGKLWADYWKTKNTQEYISCLAIALETQKEELVEVSNGKSTWVWHRLSSIVDPRTYDFYHSWDHSSKKEITLTCLIF
jgi:hypothetical protein